MEFDELKSEICKLSDKQRNLALDISKLNKEKITLMAKYSGNEKNLELLSGYIERLNSLMYDNYHYESIDNVYRKFCDKVFRRRCVFEEKFKTDHRNVLNRFSYIQGKNLAIGRVGFGTKEPVNTWKKDDDNIYINAFNLQDTIKMFSMYPVTRTPTTLKPDLLKEYQEFYDLLMSTKFTGYSTNQLIIKFNVPILLFRTENISENIVNQYNENHITGIFNDIEWHSVRMEKSDSLIIDCYRREMEFKSGTNTLHEQDISLSNNPITSGEYINPNIYRLPKQVFDVLDAAVLKLEAIRDNNKRVYDTIMEKFGHKFLASLL